MERTWYIKNAIARPEPSVYSFICLSTIGDFMQYNVTRLNEFGRNTQSPTMAMFSDWGQKNHTIVELFVLLSKMQHYRALEILMPYGIVNYSYLKHMIF
jgi:hypothetical protein